MKIRTALIAILAVLALPAAADAVQFVPVGNLSGNFVIANCLIPSGDCDNDGVVNSIDNCISVPNGDCDANPLFCDVDGDGMASPVEMAAGRQEKAKSGTLGIACSDVDGNGTMDYLESDMDGDGVPDAVDNCSDRWNPNQEDEDGDGIGDACDNCWKVANEDQADSDNDGIGDACPLDSDRDGIPDHIDNCRYKPNTGQEDADGDGIGDACDRTPGLELEDEELPETDESAHPTVPQNGNCSLVAGAKAGPGAALAGLLWLAATAVLADIRRKKV
ncbi:MAG TPA: thrombospondin type 3 repeat-containing protein [bacterium]|nr:thrombospondin type 3 repeat-containing protein [bacterium]